MKVGKHYLHKLCRITWLDPVSENDRLPVAKAPRGSSALAKWVEYGVIDDLTDGVVRFRHSESYDPGDSEVNEALFGWVQEELIASIDIMVPESPVV